MTGFLTFALTVAAFMLIPIMFVAFYAILALGNYIDIKRKLRLFEIREGFRKMIVEDCEDAIAYEMSRYMLPSPHKYPTANIADAVKRLSTQVYGAIPEKTWDEINTLYNKEAIQEFMVKYINEAFTLKVVAHNEAYATTESVL